MTTTAPENGVAYHDAPDVDPDEEEIELGDFLPEHRWVNLNGRRYLAWYAKNRRYPRRLQAIVDRARNQYLRATAPIRAWKPPAKEEVPDDEEIPIPPEVLAAIDASDEAYQKWVTISLTTLIPDLKREDAELIRTDVAEECLRKLGYFTPRVVTPGSDDPEPEEEADEGDADPLSGTTSTPASLASTTSPPTSS